MAGSDSESEDLLASVFDFSRGAAEVADQVDSPDGGGDSSNALVPLSGQGEVQAATARGVPISGQGAALAVLKTQALYKTGTHHFRLPSLPAGFRGRHGGKPKENCCPTTCILLRRVRRLPEPCRSKQIHWRR